MTHDTQSPTEIEREIERERAGLANTLDDLSDRFSLDRVVNDVTTQLRTHGGDIADSAMRQIKANPVPLALTGVGLAWLIFGNKAQDSDDTHEEAFRRSRQDQGLPYTPPTARAATPARGDVVSPDWLRPTPTVVHDTSSEPKGADRLEAAKKKANGLASDAKAYANGATDAVSEKAGELRARFAQGTEQMSEAARARVIAAREQAYSAHQTAQENLAAAQEKTRDLYERQPLIGGAIALALGAAIAAALPRTKAEDDTFGRHSDRLISDAERVFEEEKAKLKAVGTAAAEEAKAVARDAADEAKALPKRGKASAKRVAEAAKAEAKSQNLGPSVS